MKGMEIKKMNDKKYISVSQYAKIKGISQQAVYKQLKNKLKDFLIVVEGKKCLKIEVLNEVQQQSLNEVQQPIQQPFNNPIQPFLQQQIEEKDKTIESLLRQVETLQEQNGKLTELLHNSQCLLAAEKKLYIEQETKQENKETISTAEPKERKGFLSLFKRK
jgi:hypothetical protein